MKTGRGGNSGGTAESRFPIGNGGPSSRCAASFSTRRDEGLFVFYEPGGFAKLTAMRLSDAKRLLKSRRNDAGAYYMAGYAIECALKACITKNLGQYPFPLYLKEQELRHFYYTHDITALIKTAELEAALEIDTGANLSLKENWNFVKGWSETTRYGGQISRQQAEEPVQAIEDPVNGALTWLKKRW